MNPRLITLLYALVLAGAIAILYGLGINNQLVFDDARLTDGTIFGQYGGLLPLKPRLLSYGSFVWLQGILGDGWWKQRIFNIGLHIATALALYAFVLELLQRTRWTASDDEAPPRSSSLLVAAGLAVALWAFNPVAVYSVAYLVQRSILMATLLVVLACWSYVRGLAGGQRRWVVLALACYLLAVAAKEHAVSAILLTVPLFIFVQRPSGRRVLTLVAVAGVLLLAMAALLYSRYGAIVGTAFDETSRAFAAQLEQQQGGIGRQLFPLSVINQASLFFRYGLLWCLPYTGAMSIDIRPSFPLTLLSWQLLGALAWLGTLAGSAWLVLRRSDVAGLIGLALLLPGLLFVTEFSTVWLQDPFVLYRSYLWSIALPVLLAVPLVTFPHKPVYGICVLLLALLAALSFERISSLQNANAAWTDASAKIDRQAPANAVGRWRPLLNLGSESLDRGNFEEALRLFSQAEALGEPLGSARFSMGVALQQLKQYPQALDNFAQAQARGFVEAALFYQRGEALAALRRFAEAHESFTLALQHPQAPEADQFTRQRQAETAVASNNLDAAIASYQALIRQAPQRQRYKIGLSMAYAGKKDFASALDVINPAIAQHPSGPAYYARALINYYQGQRSASAQDVALALQAEPGNPAYQGLQRQLAAGPGPAPGKP